MALIVLNSSQRNSLRMASRQRVEQAFQSIPANIANQCWVDSGNAYVSDCIETLKKQTLGGKSTVTHGDLSNYIAVSAPLHCVDGWSLIGRAVDAHARGDFGAAVHLAYYAELRAAMSLLAAEGVGVFDDRHFVVRSSGKCAPVGKLHKNGASNLRTHVVAWLALEHWAGLQRSAELFRSIIRPGGIPLGNWLDAFGTGPVTSRSIAKRWLKEWGLDLKRLSAGEDREARNQASYRPTHLNNTAPMQVLDSSIFVRMLWAECQPTAISRFDILDRHLLRLTLEMSDKALQKPIGGLFANRVSKMVKDIIGDTSVAGQWQRFLTRVNDPQNPLLVTEAAGTATAISPRHHLQVMARAVLLLRVATGACSQLLQSCPFGRSELEFWWKRMGEERGLWPTGDDPIELTDLWSDIDAAIEDLNDWEMANAGTAISHAQWRRALPQQISVMGECERIGLWGLGL